jgi:hypothetical protein
VIVKNQTLLIYKSGRNKRKDKQKLSKDFTKALFLNSELMTTVLNSSRGHVKDFVILAVTAVVLWITLVAV